MDEQLLQDVRRTEENGYEHLKNLVTLVREQTIPTERPPLVGEIRVKFTTDCHSMSMPWCLVHPASEGLHPNEFQSDIWRGTLRRNFLCYRWEGCM
jgi:hypothetical protein